jgi:hypothetical protein
LILRIHSQTADYRAAVDVAGVVHHPSGILAVLDGRRVGSMYFYRKSASSPIRTTMRQKWPKM